MYTVYGTYLKNKIILEGFSNNIRIIQTSPQRTGSIFLINLLIGFINDKQILESPKYNSSNIPDKYLEDNIIIKSHDIDIDSWIQNIKNYKLYFICSEQNQNVIDEKFKKYDNVICINYDEMLVTPVLELNTIVNNLYTKIRSFLPDEIKMSKKNGLDRIMNKTNKMLYLHFHKCAGTTIINCLKKKYKPYQPCDSNCNPVTDLKENINFLLFDNIDLYEFLLSQEFDFFCIEFSFFNRNIIFPKNLKIYTVLRNAYNRFISNYNHDTDLSRLESAVNRGYRVTNYNDYQNLNINYKNNNYNLFNKNNYYTKLLNGLSYDANISDNNYKYALERLNSFTFVAILEEKESYDKLFKLMNIEKYSIKNSSTYKNVPKFYNYTNINRYDLSLYNHFKKHIPYIIHQSWKTNDLTTYSDGKIGSISQSKWKELYPDFNYMFWTDDDINRYINKQSKNVIDTFNSLNENIKRMDFFRYLILYEYGGIYSDMDFIPNKRIDENIFNNYNFLGYKASRDSKLSDSNGYKYYNYDNDGVWTLGQAFFACNRNNEDLIDLINDIIVNKFDVKDPLLHTGPEKINQIFFLNKKLLHEYTYIFSKKDMANQHGNVGYHKQSHNWN